MSHIAFIGLGSNLENPRRQLARAFSDISTLPGTTLLKKSSLYCSAPLNCPDMPDFQAQPDFVNAVAKIDTTLLPQSLLESLLQIELLHGRERTFRNAPRTLDLDVLLYDDFVLHEDGLTIPHQQMHMRAFVLKPLLEIAPDIIIPGIGEARSALDNCLGQVLERLPDAA